MTIAARMGKRYDSAASGHLCGQTGGFADTTQRDLIVAQVMQDSLRALIAQHDGKTEQAIELFEKATAAEGAMSLDFGPPIIVKPSHELYGEMLLDLGLPEEARVQFEAALARAPRRSLSLAGLARAAEAIGDAALVSKSCAEIAAIYVAADEGVKRPGYCR